MNNLLNNLPKQFASYRSVCLYVTRPAKPTERVLRYSPSGRARQIIWLTAAVFALCLTGCKTRVQEANALAKQAGDTGDTLEIYYAALSKQPSATAQLVHADTLEQTTLNGVIGYTIANRLSAQDLRPAPVSAQPPYTLAAYLKRASRPADVFFRQRLKASTLALLAQYDEAAPPAPALNAAIAADLNERMDSGGEMWYAQLNGELKDVPLSPQAQTLLAQYDAMRTLTLFPALPDMPEPVTGRQRRVSLNRWILDSAYPDAIRPTLAEAFAAQAQEIQTRQAVAHELKNIGDALQRLTGTEASDRVKEAAARLQSLVEDINYHPLTIASKDPVINNILASRTLNLSPSTIAARLFETITQMQQEKDFRRLLPRVDVFLQQLAQLFDAEQPTYLSISANYHMAVAARDMTALDDPSLAVSAIDPKRFAPYGFAVEARPQTTGSQKQEAKIQIEQTAFQNVTTAQQEIVSLSGRLHALHAAFHRFLERSKIRMPSGTLPAQAQTTPRIAPVPSS